jgi:hypothetical protein
MNACVAVTVSLVASWKGSEPGAGLVVLPGRWAGGVGDAGGGEGDGDGGGGGCPGGGGGGGGDGGGGGGGASPLTCRLNVNSIGSGEPYEPQFPLSVPLLLTSESMSNGP